MKAPTLSLMCFLLSVEKVASLGFSFSNLLFYLHAPGAPPHCQGPLAPRKFCEITCNALASSGRRLEESSDNLTWTASACAAIEHHPWYKKCMEGAVESCDLDADAVYEEYVEEEEEEEEQDADADVDSYVDYLEDTSSSVGTNSADGASGVSRYSYMPFVIAASVATMFVGIYVWKKKREEKQQINENLLDDDESFHGSVARRLESGTMSSPTPSAEPEFIKTTGYAMA